MRTRTTCPPATPTRSRTTTRSPFVRPGSTSSWETAGAISPWRTFTRSSKTGIRSLRGFCCPFSRGWSWTTQASGKPWPSWTIGNLQLDAESAPAAIYMAWEANLRQHAEDLFVPAGARDMVTVPTVRVLDWYTSPDGHFGDDPIGGRDGVLIQSLAEAVQQLTEKFGPDMNEWAYGHVKNKHLWIRHALSEVVSEGIRARLDVGPAPRGGSGLHRRSGRIRPEPNQRTIVPDYRGRIELG